LTASPPDDIARLSGKTADGWTVLLPVIFMNSPISDSAVNSQSPPTWAEVSACLYLLIPTALFFLYFVRIEFKLPALILITCCAYSLVVKLRGAAAPRLSIAFPIMALAGTLWLLIGGYFEWFFSLTSDWHKHYALFKLLASEPWPPVIYSPEHGVEVLRYSLGFYLVPSLISKFAGPGLLSLCVAAWTLGGVFLLFSLMKNLLGHVPNAKRLVFALATFILFSGADVVGTAITNYHHGPAYHLEWWPQWIQYVSNTTALFWVPQHAIPSWLGIALVLSQRRRPWLISFAVPLFGCLLFWSPFAAIGLLPFLLLCYGKRSWRGLFSLWNVLSIALILPPIVGYLAAGAGGIPHGPATPSVADYVLFIGLEVAGPLAFLMIESPADRPVLVVAAVILLTLPFYRFGLANDLAGRASLPSLACIAIVAAGALASGVTKRNWLLVLILITGAATPLSEMYRSATSGASYYRQEDAGKAFEALADVRTQYFAPYPIWMLRPGMALDPKRPETGALTQLASLDAFIRPRLTKYGKVLLFTPSEALPSNSAYARFGDRLIVVNDREGFLQALQTGVFDLIALTGGDDDRDVLSLAERNRIPYVVISTGPGGKFLTRAAWFSSRPAVTERDLTWAPWAGMATRSLHFDVAQRTVASAVPTDAALVSSSLPRMAQAVLYARFEGSVSSGAKHAAHMGVMGRELLLPLPSGTYEGTRQFVMPINGEIFNNDGRLAFGLGGWATGSGSIRLVDMKIVEFVGDKRM
jgi:hypothetical protein